MDNFTYTAYLVGSNKPEKRLHLSPKKEKKSHPELTQLWDPVQFSLYSFHRNVGKYPRRNTQQATIVFLYKTFWDIKVWSNAPMIAFRQKKKSQVLLNRISTIKVWSLLGSCPFVDFIYHACSMYPNIQNKLLCWARTGGIKQRLNITTTSLRKDINLIFLFSIHYWLL